MDKSIQPMAPLFARQRSWQGASGISAYLTEVLDEAIASLKRCGREERMPTHHREAVRGLIRDAERLLVTIQWETPAAPEQGGINGVVRAGVRDVERAALFDAFRERCGSLGTRLSQPQNAEAALNELHQAVRTLARGPHGGLR